MFSPAFRKVVPSMGAALTLVVFSLVVPGSACAGPISAGLELWLDASDAGTFTFASGSQVSQWADKSGNGNDASTGFNYPTLQANAIGGRPAVSFTSTQAGAPASTPLSIPGGLNVIGNQDRTVLLVMNYSVQIGNNEIFGTSTGNMVDVGTWTPSGTQNERLRLRQTGSAFSAAHTVPLGPNLIAIQGDSTGTRAWRNGTPIINDAGSFFHWAMNSNMGVGGSGFPGREYDGQLAEMIVYDRALSDLELNSVGFYLQQKYGLAGSYAPVKDGLELWLDASDAGTLNLDGSGKVLGWQDKSGNSHNAAPLGGRPAPQWLADGINGRPAIEFDQSARNVMGIAGDMGIASGQERTVFVVMDYDSLRNNNEILGTSTGQMVDVGTWTPSGTQNERLRLRQDSVNAFSGAGDLPLGTHILTLVTLADGTIALSDGVQIIDTSLLAQHYPIGADLKIGGTDFNGRDYDGLIAEMMIFDRALDSAEINQVGYYLEQKYGLDTAFVAVPEPTSWILLGLGGLCLVGYCRRRRTRTG
jgi:hypothetical protein